MMRNGWDWDSARRFLTGQAWWAMGSLWLALVAWAAMNGPRLRAEPAREAAIEAEFEDRDACRRLNMPFGSESYSACASEFDQIRRHQIKRTERVATAGL